MKYLITGGCGFLGSNIAAELISQGISPIIFDNLSRYGSFENLNWLHSLGGCQFTHGDIRNSGDVQRVIQAEMPDIIFHLAGQVAMTTSIQNPRLDFEVNALGSLNILESVRKVCPNAAVIYSSSNKVYGDLQDLRFKEGVFRYECEDYPMGIPETLALSFHSPYGCSKGSADQYMLDYARIFGIKTLVFRHSSMYGGRQFSTYDQGWIGWFCQQAIKQSLGGNIPFTISGNGKQVRDVLYSHDMVRLYLMSAKNIELMKGQAFNIGGGMENSLSILELMQMLEEILGVKLHWNNIAPRESDQLLFVSDLKKIKSALNWEPQIKKREGIIRMIDWVRSVG